VAFLLEKKKGWPLSDAVTSLITVMLEAVRTPETSVKFVTTWRYIPEFSKLHTCCRENLKSHMVLPY
jgi:hypothetical protein